MDPQGQVAQPPGQFEPHVVDPVVRVVELPKAVLMVPAEARAKKARTTSNVNIILIIQQVKEGVKGVKRICLLFRVIFFYESLCLKAGAN